MLSEKSTKKHVYLVKIKKNFDWNILNLHFYYYNFCFELFVNKKICKYNEYNTNIIIMFDRFEWNNKNVSISVFSNKF